MSLLLPCTFVAVPFEVKDGADVTVLAGLGLTHSSCARAFTGLSTVLGDKPFSELQDEDREEKVRNHHRPTTDPSVPTASVQGSIC